jgi:aminopeptidase N
MTLHQLRLAVGDKDFFRIMRRWASSQSGGTVTTDEFIDLAERISGQQLDSLFETWLFTPGRPDLPGAAARSGPSAQTFGATVRTVPPAARSLLARFDVRR